MASAAQVFVDEIEVTHIALEGSVTHSLNRPWTATMRCPMQEAIGGVNSLMKVYIDGDLWFHGKVLQTEVTADEQTGYTVYNATDALELWTHRPVRDPPDTSGKYGAPGNFSKPSLLEDFQFAPRIVQAMMDGSELNTIPSQSEGPLRLARGSVAIGTADVSGAPTDWPMTMAELATMLISSGQVDIVVTPIELDGNGNYGRIDLFNGDFGDDHTGDVIFQYGFGARNIRALRWNEDMSQLCNKLWYYLGPKCDDQHWRANITGTDPGLPDPPQTDVQAKALTSRAIYDTRMDIKIYDAVGDGGPCAESVVVGHELYRRLWQEEAWLRAEPHMLVHITPTRDTEIGTFEVGDLVTVEASPDIGGISHLDSSQLAGGQRIYEFTASWNEDSVVELSELQTSTGNEGLT